MDLGLKAQSLEGWQRYFTAAELPVALYYTDECSATWTKAS